MFNDFRALSSIGVPDMDLDIGENYLIDGWDVVGGGFYVTGCLVNITIKDEGHAEANAILFRTFGLSEPFHRINSMWSIYDRGQSLKEIARKK